VRHVGRPFPLTGQQVGDPRRQPVERCANHRKFAGASWGRAGGQIAVGQAFRGAGQRGDRGDQPAAEAVSDEESDGDQHQPQQCKQKDGAGDPVVQQLLGNEHTDNGRARR
jgi:hypothetical protein